MPEVRRDGAFLGAFVAMIALVAYVATVAGALPGLLLLAPAAGSFLLGSRAPRYPGLALVIALAAGVIVLDAEPVPALLVTAGPWILGAAVGARRELVRHLAERAAELEHQERRLAELTARRERLRIAADLHHLVGHHLAVVVVQAGAGRLMPTGDGDAKAACLIGIRRSAAEVLIDIDRLGATLAPEGRGELAARLAGIIDGVQASGVAAELRGEPPAGLPDEVVEQVIRIVQEALTNAIKHAPGAHVDVGIALEGDHLTLAVDDTGARGAGPALAGSGSGFGIGSLAAEAEARGGWLAAGAGPSGGWRVRAVLPLRQAVTLLG